MNNSKFKYLSDGDNLQLPIFL